MSIYDKKTIELHLNALQASVNFAQVEVMFVNTPLVISTKDEILKRLNDEYSCPREQTLGIMRPRGFYRMRLFV